MALAYQGNGPRSLRSYISTDVFFNYIRSYETKFNSKNFKTEGRLTSPATLPGVPTAAIRNVATKADLISVDCPPGIILRETGRRLYPGQNPGLNEGDVFDGEVVGTTSTQTLWVMVVDNITGISVFIDPNDRVFSLYNSDKPLELVHPLEGVDGSRLGAPVYTRGDVIASGQVRSSIILEYDQSIFVGGSLTVDPKIGQNFNITGTMIGPVTVSVDPMSAIEYPGAIINLKFTNGGGQLIQGDGTTVITSAPICMTAYTPSGATANNIFSISFISNGTAFVQLASPTSIIARSYKVDTITTSTGYAINPAVAQLYEFTIPMTGDIIINCADAALYPGVTVTLMFTNGNGHLIKPGTFAVFGDILLTVNKRTCVTFISDSFNFIPISVYSS